MPDDTATATRDRVAGATVAPILGAVRIGLPPDLQLEIVTTLARMCHDTPELVERLVQLGDADAAMEDHDLQQEVGDGALQMRVYDAQAPFADLAAAWDVPLSEARTLGVRIVSAWHEAGSRPLTLVETEAP